MILERERENKFLCNPAQFRVDVAAYRRFLGIRRKIEVGAMKQRAGEIGGNVIGEPRIHDAVYQSPTQHAMRIEPLHDHEELLAIRVKNAWHMLRTQRPEAP